MALESWCRNRDRRSLIILTEFHDRLCVYLAKRMFKVFVGTGIQIDDMIQEGRMGLQRALTKFDIANGATLGTYASWWINAFMARYVDRNIHPVKFMVTQGVRNIQGNIHKLRRECQEENPDATEAEIQQAMADKANVPLRHVQSVLASKKACVSLDAPIKGGHDDSDRTYLDCLTDTESPMLTEERVDTWDQRKFRLIVDSYMLDMPKNWQLIYRERIISDEPMTLQELGDIVGVSRERIRQVEAKIMARLKNFLKRINYTPEGYDYAELQSESEETDNRNCDRKRGQFRGRSQRSGEAGALRKTA